MNSDRIELAARYVWWLLKRAPYPISIERVTQPEPPFSSSELYAGLGWLAHEGKLEWSTDGVRTEVTLTSKEFST